MSWIFTSISSWMTSIAQLFSLTKYQRLLMVGLDAAGKTTILYKLDSNKSVIFHNVVMNNPFNAEIAKTVKFKNAIMCVLDIGGHEKMRPYYRPYFQGATGLIFVIDSNDTERIDEAREELTMLMGEDELANANILILANKQDLPNAMSTSQIIEKMQLHNLKNRIWQVQPCVATTGEGICEGLNWLTCQSKS